MTSVFKSKYIVWIGMMICLFVVPYMVPSSVMAISASYDYGFNNKIGMLMLVLFSIANIIYSYRGKNKEMVANIFDKHGYKLDYSLYKKIALLSIFISFLIYVGCFRPWEYKAVGVGESSYFMAHYYDLFYGRTMYKDFEFCYGPLMLYIPYFVHLVLPSLELLTAYWIGLTLEILAGEYFLFTILNILSLSIKEKKICFIFISLMFLPLSGGVNGTLARCLLPFWMLVTLFGYEKTKKKLLFFTLISTLVGINFSPEYGIAYCMTVIVFSVFKIYYEKKLVYVFNAILPILSVALTYAIFPNMFLQMMTFSSGGLNWPFVISYFLVLFFYSIFTVSEQTGLLLKSIRKNLEQLCFILLAFSCIPGALGRCDPWHLFAYGFFMFLMCYVYSTHQNSLRVGQKKFAMLLVGMLIITLPTSLVWCAREYSKTLVEGYIYYRVYDGETKSVAIPPWWISVGEYINRDVAGNINKFVINDFDNEKVKISFIDIGEVGVPFYIDTNVEFMLADESKLIGVYCRNIGAIGSTQAIEQNLSTLKDKQPQYLCLPRTYNVLSNSSNYKGDITHLFLAPYTKAQTRNGNEAYLSLINYINNNYSFYREVNSDLIIVKRT